MELQPELIPVHAIDNGMVLYIPDSGGARAVKTAAMTLAAGPIGLAAGALTRGLRAECQTCGKVFARSPYSAAIQEKIIALVSRGELVIRSYTPPPVPEYRSDESHSIATRKKTVSPDRPKIVRREPLGPPRKDRRSAVFCVISVVLFALAITGWSKGLTAWCEIPLVLLAIVSSVLFLDAVGRTMMVSAAVQEGDTLQSG